MDPMDMAILLRTVKSIEAFTGDDPSFVWGDWKAWEAACYAEGRTIPPAEFKALPEEKRRSYLKPLT